MGQRERHHVVPRFLLNRFAAESYGGKAFIWKFTRSDQPRLLSTRDVGVQKRFYGSESEGLEGELAAREGEWADLLRDVDAGKKLATLSSDLWYMVASLASRAGQIRSALGSLGERFITHLCDNGDDPRIKAGLVPNFDREFSILFEKLRSGLPPETQAVLIANYEVIREHAKQHFRHTNIGPLLQALLGPLLAEAKLPPIVKKAHNQALSKLVVQREGPELLAPIEWRVLSHPAHALVLGDCPVVAVGGDSMLTGAPWKFGPECRSFYLPISPENVLVGLRNPADPLLSIDELNAASVELSEHAFFANADTDTRRMWQSRVGLRWMPMDEEEIVSLIEQVINNHARKAGEAGED